MTSTMFMNAVYLLGAGSPLLTTKFQFERDMYKVDFIQFKQKDKNCGNATFVIFYIKIVCDFVIGILTSLSTTTVLPSNNRLQSGREIGEKREEGL